MKWLPLLLAVYIGFTALVLFILSRFGWAKLARHYRYDRPFDGQRIGTISAAVNFVNYNNTLDLQYSGDGLYLKPKFMVRLFHPPVFIPWLEIKNIREKKLLFTRIKELEIGLPRVATLKMKAATFEQLEHLLPAGNAR